MFNVLKAFKKFSCLKTSIKSNLLFKLNLKFVSGNPQSKENREKREIDKANKYWENVENEYKKKMDFVKEIEKKYDEETLYVGRHINLNHKGQIDAQIEQSLVELYYIPLTVNDSKLLSNFSKEAAEKIFKGGRLVLYNEIKNFNKSQPLDNQLQFNPPFEPLSAEDINELKSEFSEICDDDYILNFVLQSGKSLFNELKEIKEEKADYYLTYLEKLNYIDHYGEVIKSVPFNTNISVDFKKYDDPQYVKFYLSNTNFNENQLVDQLKEIYFNFYKQLEASVNTNSESNLPLDNLKDQLEPCLLDRTYAFVDYLNHNKIKFEFKKKSESVEEKYMIFEKLFIKGVNLNRYLNSDPDEFILIDSHEDLGVRYYLHKFYIGEANKPPKTPLISSSKYESEDFNNYLSFSIKERNRKIVLRVYMFLKHPYQLEMIKNESVNLIEYPNNYTYNHLAIFENQLEAPHHTYLIYNNFESWLLKHKLNPEGWRLADVDNFMKGNPFFIKKSSFQQNFEAIINNQEETFNILAEKFPEIKNPQNFTLNLKEDKKPVKKERKKKEAEKPTQDEYNGPINALEFDYKITKIKKNVDEKTYLKDYEDIKKIHEEYKKLQLNEIEKNSDFIDKQLNKESEFRYSLLSVRLNFFNFIRKI
jgi:hypothetical protein